MKMKNVGIIKSAFSTLVGKMLKTLIVIYLIIRVFARMDKFCIIESTFSTPVGKMWKWLKWLSFFFILLAWTMFPPSRYFSESHIVCNKMRKSLIFFFLLLAWIILPPRVGIFNLFSLSLKNLLRQSSRHELLLEIKSTINFFSDNF